MPFEHLASSFGAEALVAGDPFLREEPLPAFDHCIAVSPYRLFVPALNAMGFPLAISRKSLRHGTTTRYLQWRRRQPPEQQYCQLENQT